MFLTKLTVACLALGLTLVCGSALAGGQRHEAEPEGGRVVVFGDSLSDTGNVFAVTGELNRPPYGELDASRIPSVPYALGAGRFTNGPTWVDIAAREASLEQDVRPALRARRPGRNYAFGSARAGVPLQPDSALHLSDQVARFLADVNGSISEDDVIVMFIGSNDVADAVRVLAIDPTGLSSVGGVVTAIASVSENLSALVAAGARNFLILNVPDIGLIPALRPPLAPPGLTGIATCWTLLFNLGTPLPAGCPGLPPGLPGLDDVVAALGAHSDVYVKLIDTFTFASSIVADPRRYGLRNVTDTCVQPNVAPYHCARPDSYFFWDGVHPTRAVHRLLADEVMRQIFED